MSKGVNPAWFAEVAQGRQVVYADQTAPLKKFYGARGLLKTIDGVGSPDGIYAELKKIIGKK